MSEPQAPSGPTEPTNGEPVDDGSGAVEGLEEIVSIILDNEPLLLGLILLGAIGIAFYKKYDRRVHNEYEEKNWDEIIVNDLKFILAKAGMKVDKELTRGDEISLGEVYSWDQFNMPAEHEFEDLMFVDEGKLDEENFEDVHIFLVAPSGLQNKMWKFTDLYMNKNTNTTIYIVNSDKVTEEEHRFKLDRDIDFKKEHGSIMVQKGTATENMTNQQPVYSARKNLVQGLDEFSEKVMSLDRSHIKEIAKIREEADADAQQLLEQFKNH